MIMLHRETLFAEKGRAGQTEYGLERHTEAGFVRGWSIEVVPR